MTEEEKEDINEKEEDVFCDDEVCEAIEGLNAFCEAVPEGDARNKCSNIMELLRTGELDVKKARAQLLEDIGEDMYLKGAEGLKEWMFPEGEVEPVPEVVEVPEPEVIEEAGKAESEEIEAATFEETFIPPDLVEKITEEAPEAEPEIPPITVELSTEPSISIEIPPVEAVPEKEIEELEESIPEIPPVPELEEPEPSSEPDLSEASSEDPSKQEYKESHPDD